MSVLLRENLVSHVESNLPVNYRNTKTPSRPSSPYLPSLCWLPALPLWKLWHGSEYPGGKLGDAEGKGG